MNFAGSVLLTWLVVFSITHKFQRTFLVLSLSTSVSTFPTTSLISIGKSQLAVLDGGEWSSVLQILKEEIQELPTTKHGYLTVVTGRDHENRRVVAMQCMEEDKSAEVVFKESMAVIPDQVSDEDAIATFITALSCVHCALPKLENVGGGSESIPTGRALVLGSSEVACFAAEGLTCMGIDVFVVNGNGSAKISKKNSGKIQVIKPAIGSSETGFSAHVGEFDSLVDTIGNERSVGLSIDDPLVNNNEFVRIDLPLGPSVLDLLSSRHGCHKYISMYTFCQEIVANEGIFVGPRKADQYCQQVGNVAFLRQSKECQALPPLKSLGNTLEILMNKGVVFRAEQWRKLCSKKSSAIRGWTLADFWEATSWPRDASGTGTVRYGLPARESLMDETEDEFMVSESPYRKEQARGLTKHENYDEIGDFGLNPPYQSSSSENRATQNNPYVLNVLGVEGVQSEIVDSEKDCIIFLSAKFCKTCRNLNSLYTRMARLNHENENTSISFVKAETSGETGRALGRHLSVQAVPAFVLFRKGQQYGVPLSVSKLPSRKLDRALELLSTGAPWDDSILNEEEYAS